MDSFSSSFYDDFGPSRKDMYDDEQSGSEDEATIRELAALGLAKEKKKTVVNMSDFSGKSKSAKSEQLEGFTLPKIRMAVIPPQHQRNPPLSFARIAKQPAKDMLQRHLQPYKKAALDKLGQDRFPHILRGCVRQAIMSMMKQDSFKFSDTKNEYILELTPSDVKVAVNRDDQQQISGVVYDDDEECYDNDAPQQSFVGFEKITVTITLLPYEEELKHMKDGRVYPQIADVSYVFEGLVEGTLAHFLCGGHEHEFNFDEEKVGDLFDHTVTRKVPYLRV